MSKNEKLAAYRAFNFDKDEAYKAYLRSIELPATNQEQALQKVKAKWWKREKDNDFDVDWALGVEARPSAPASSARPTSSSAPPPNYANSGSHSGGGTYQPSRPATGTGSTAGDQSFLMFSNVALVLLAVVYFSPFLGRRISFTAYRYFLTVLMVSSIHRVIKKYGIPPIGWNFSGINWQALQMWANRVVSSNEAHSALLGLAFLTQPPISMLLVAPLLSVGYQLMDHASGRWPASPLWVQYGAKLQRLMQDKKRDVQLASAVSEVAIGFMLLIQLVTAKRNFMLLFLYWNILKSRYSLGEAAQYHQQVWRLIGSRVRPVINNIAPLKQAADYVEGVFTGRGR